MNHTVKLLEFNQILEILGNCAVSVQGKDKLRLLSPTMDEGECIHKMQETTEARKILETFQTPPLAVMKDIDKVLILCKNGSMLIPEQLQMIALFITACKRMKSYLSKAEQLEYNIAFYGRSFVDLHELQEEIERSIRGNEVDDGASPELRNIRRKIENTNQKIGEKLESMLRGNGKWFADNYIAKRNGRFVLPVRKEYKNMVKGSVVEVSGSGSTCFIEPAVVGKLSEELNILEIQEENEVHRILYTLTGMVEESAPLIQLNMEAMISLDVIFAKAKLSIDMKAGPVQITTKREIVIHKGRHPLLNDSDCIPLDFTIGDEISGIVITGPNTGGKTVALKTVGLLSMMAQSGLHVPVGKGSIFGMFDLVLCDIGDGQSISQNLSTFSSHIINIIDILKKATRESLVLLDELGSGTDPAEGMGIAVAILEELRTRNCLFVATTHYPEVKEYASHAPHLINARMAFDRESLRPLYKLEIGASGESCALYIAERLEFPPHLLKIARKASQGELIDKDSFSESEYSHAQSASDRRNKKRAADVNKTIIGVSNKNNRGSDIEEKFQIGDSVYIQPDMEIGIIYQKVNEKGEVEVQVKGEKKMVSHKRVKLHVRATELYPDDYDFSVIFDTVENRKARHKMDKGYQKDLEIVYENKTSK